MWMAAASWRGSEGRPPMDADLFEQKNALRTLMRQRLARLTRVAPVA